MKRIYFFFFLMILFCTSISWAGVNYTSVDFSGPLVADDNPIVRVLNSDGTHRATSKATLRGRITVNCTVSVGSYGTLDIAITGSIRKGDTDLDTVAGAQDHLIGAGPAFPTSVAERCSAYGRNYNYEPYDPAYETDQTGTYVLNGKATITRSGSGGANFVEYLGAGVGVSDSATYASQIGQQIDSVVVTMTTHTFSDSVSGDACRVMVISSSGSVSLDEGCDGNGNCPPRRWHGSMQFRHGRCGGDFCNCNSGSSGGSSGGSNPPTDNTPNCPDCASHCSPSCSCTNSGTCNGSASTPSTPTYHACGEHEMTVSGDHSNGTYTCGSHSGYACQESNDHETSISSCSSTNSDGNTCTNSSGYYECSPHTHTYPPSLVACGARSWTGCTAAVSSRTEHKVSSCSTCGNRYWTCSAYASNHTGTKTCRYSECRQTWQKCGRAPICNKPYRNRNGLKCWAE